LDNLRCLQNYVLKMFTHDVLYFLTRQSMPSYLDRNINQRTMTLLQRQLLVGQAIATSTVLSKNQVKQAEHKIRAHTLRGLLWTSSTAFWLLRCSQSPSDAKMMNWSVNCIGCTVIAGSELRSGLRKVSGRRNLLCKGSLLNSGLFRYTSPMDLVICKTSSDHVRCTKEAIAMAFAKRQRPAAD
jgi:hypothetical protein